MAAHAIFCLQRRAKPRSLSAQAMTRRAQAARVQGNGPGGRAVVRDRCCSIPSAVIVTGGARGLGRAMTLGLANAGVPWPWPSCRRAGRRSANSSRSHARKASPTRSAIDCDVTRWEDCRAAGRESRHEVRRRARPRQQCRAACSTSAVLVGAQEIPRGRCRHLAQEHRRQPQRTVHDGQGDRAGPGGEGLGRIVNIQTSNFTMMEGFALRPVQGGARGRDGDLGQGPRGHRRDRERARARRPPARA